MEGRLDLKLLMAWTVLSCECCLSLFGDFNSKVMGTFLCSYEVIVISPIILLVPARLAVFRKN